MKTKFTILMFGVMVFSALQLSAQTQNESRIKVLPTEKSGVIKILYAMSSDSPITVKFTAKNGETFYDQIKGNYSRGVIKKYDVRHINSDDFKVEISSAAIGATYRIMPSKDRRKFVSSLETTSYNHAVVASRQ